MVSKIVKILIEEEIIKVKVSYIIDLEVDVIKIFLVH